MTLQSWVGPNTPYLILHSRYRGELHKPWQVIRCNTGDDEQELVFEGSRESAVVFLKNNWDCDNLSH